MSVSPANSRSPVGRYSWDSVPKEQLSPLITRQVIHCATMTIARIELRSGAAVPTHSHENEQISTIERGRVRFVLGRKPSNAPTRDQGDPPSSPVEGNGDGDRPLDGVETIIAPGDILHIPAHVPHSAEALEDSVAVDLFSPPREDWIRGDDAYLRRKS